MFQFELDTIGYAGSKSEEEYLPFRYMTQVPILCKYIGKLRTSHTKKEKAETETLPLSLDGHSCSLRDIHWTSTRSTIISFFSQLL